VDGRARFGGGAPQLGGLKADAVERVRLRALSMCVGVRKDEGPVHANDDAELVARVSRQSCVSDRRIMTRDDLIAKRVTGRWPGLAKWGAGGTGFQKPPSGAECRSRRSIRSPRGRGHQFAADRAVFSASRYTERAVLGSRLQHVTADRFSGSLAKDGLLRDAQLVGVIDQ
jgi:hypothetical protein